MLIMGMSAWQFTRINSMKVDEMITLDLHKERLTIQQLIDKISRASEEQSDYISQINLAMGQINSTIQQNVSLV